MPYRIIRSMDGRRGSALALISAMLLVIGWSFIRPREGRSPVLAWLPDWFTNTTVGWVVLGLAAVALIAGVFSRWWGRWALPIGYGAAMGASSTLAFLYTAGWVLGLSAPYHMVAIFVAFTTLIWMISGWDESRPHPPMSDRQRRIVSGEVDR